MRLGSVIENDIAALEAAHRGFLLTGDNAYLRAVRIDGAIRSSARSEDLAGLILDSPPQRKRVMKVQEIVQKWLDTIGRTARCAQQRK